ncbi:MAG: ATP-binding protein, partial [Chloroflexota bacterium]
NWTVDSLREIEDEKQRTEQLRRDLIAWISHDLRTPLTAVQASLEAIADDIVTDPEMVKDYVHNSLGELDNLRLLIDDLFAIAQIDAGHMSLKFTEASLSDLISDTVSSLYPHAQKREVSIAGEIQSDMPPVYMAPDKIQRVMYNLIDNAIRHTPAGGTITISARSINNKVQVDVHNTGESIPEEHLPHLFEKFYRGEQARQRDVDGHRGAGLGLAIAQGFIDAHQGKIWVNSDEQRGTTFAFAIPVGQHASSTQNIR